jgi:prepilin-type processing-associated H-X9-DG protein
VIYLTENADTSTVDHFPSYCWNTNDPIYNEMGMSNWCPNSLDANGYPTAAIAWNRHTNGFNSMYVDGHAKWGQWSQLWFQKPSENVYEGSFDPRQP